MELAGSPGGSHGGAMNRVHLWLAALQVLSLVAIGWLWSENRSLRTHPDEVQEAGRRPAESPAAQRERLAPQRETGSGPKWGAPKRSPGDSPQNARNDAPRGDDTNQRSPTGSQGPSKARGTGGPDDRLPQEETAIPETGLIAAPQKPEGDSLIVNGGFDGELAPWLCEEGRVTRDPDDERNSLLEASLNDSGFRLAQSFGPPATKAPMNLSFRAQLSADTAQSGFDLMLLGQDDRPLALTFVEAGKPGEWKVIEWKVSTPVAPASLRIGSSPGVGVVRIDDVRLEQSKSVPPALKGQASP